MSSRLNSMAVEDDIAAQMRISSEPTAVVESSTSAAKDRPTGPSFSHPTKLEPFLLLAKSARGAGAAKLIEQATSASGVFVFAELLDSGSVKELANTDQFRPHYELLRLFAYGTYKQYQELSGSLPPLQDAQIIKLKMLTLISLASASRTLPYSLLTEQLNIQNIRELEDLIIEAIYSDLIAGRIDQLNSRFSVDSVTSRDVPAVEPLFEALQKWSQKIEHSVDLIDQKIAETRALEKYADDQKLYRANNIRRIAFDLISTSNKEDAKGVTAQQRSPVKTRAARSNAVEADVMELDEQESPRKGGGTRTNRKRTRA